MFNDSFILLNKENIRENKEKIKKVTKEGFEPSRPYEHHPSRWRVTVSPLGLKQQRRCNATSFNYSVTWLGFEPRIPIIKSDVLYQLSYQVGAFKK